MKSNKTVIYPGTFDPITNGHFDLIQRAINLFDTVIIAVSDSRQNTLFSISERVQLIQEATQSIAGISVISFSSLLVDLVNKYQACAIIRGLRAVSDFDYEFQLAMMNRRLNHRLETIFLTPAEENTFISSTLVRELASLNGNINQFTPASVSRLIQTKIQSKA